MFRNLLLCLIIVLFTCECFSQIGGKYTYSFLKTPNSARVSALGGSVVAICDNDLNLTFHNPSLLTQSMDNQVVINYVDYFANINFGYISYARYFSKYGIFAAGLHYMNYGKFTAADETGTITGNFSASEYALNLIYSKPLDSSFTAGINIKPVLSLLEEYSSFGIASDIGITYNNKKRNLSIALVASNIGVQVKRYREGNGESLPFDLQFGISKKIKHAPFRICFLAHNLYTWDMTYVNTNLDEQSADVAASDTVADSKFTKFLDNAARHTIWGLEFIPKQSFFLRIGYNYQRRKELTVPTRTFLVGFSFGAGIKIYKFQLSYGFANYHLANSTHHFSLTVNLSDFLKKKVITG